MVKAQASIGSCLALRLSSMKLTPTEIIECLIRGNHSRCSSKYAKFGCKPAINLNSAPFFFFGSKMTTVTLVPVDYPSQEGEYKTGPQDYARIITIVFPTEKPRGRSDDAFTHGGWDAASLSESNPYN